jgi:hypothetical protein
MEMQSAMVVISVYCKETFTNHTLTIHNMPSFGALVSKPLKQALQGMIFWKLVKTVSIALFADAVAPLPLNPNKFSCRPPLFWLWLDSWSLSNTPWLAHAFVKLKAVKGNTIRVLSTGAGAGAGGAGPGQGGVTTLNATMFAKMTIPIEATFMVPAE